MDLNTIPSRFNICRVAAKLTTLVLILTLDWFASAIGGTNALASGSVYYVDFTLGNDGYAGTESSPWKTINKVNSSSVIGGDTVFFKRGETWNEYLYPKSGTAESPTVYSAYGIGDKPTANGIIVSSKSFINISDLNLNNSSYYQPLSITNGSHNITVHECDFIGGVTNTSGSAVHLNDSTYISIKKCKIEHKNPNAYSDALQIRGRTSYCLIDGNSVGTATHYSVSMLASTDANKEFTGHHNIIKNNTVNNPEGAQVEVMSDSKYNLFDSNLISGGKSTSRCSYLPRSFKLVTEGNIVRRNIIKDNLEATGSGLSSEVYAYQDYPPNIASKNRVYNNIITNIAHYPLVIATNGDNGTSAYDNHYKNNIIYGNDHVYDVIIQNHTAIHDNYFENNLIYHNGATNVIFNGSQGETSIVKVQDSDPVHWLGNLDKDPLLDEEHYPQANSPVIDSAAALTVITNATGVGTSFTVADSSYFCDGWGIIPGDTIQIGDSITTITSINYSENMITVSEPIFWVQGMGVSLPFNGTALDIGAKERNLSYTITATSGAGGAVAPAGITTVSSGGSQTYSITPGNGYRIAEVTVDGASVGTVSSYTFSNVSANHTISATFTVITYTYTITATSGAGGAVAPAGITTVSSGGSQTYSITPDSGYRIAEVTVDGASVGALSSYTFSNVTANHTISATFTVITYTITATSGAGGVIAPAGITTVSSGGSQTYSITPDSGYRIAEVTVDGASVGALSSYTFSNVSANHTISATFTVITYTYTITATSSAGGAVAPAGITTVSSGGSQTYSITPDNGYRIAEVTVDGASVGALSSYTFSNVTANHTISATFTAASLADLAVVKTSDRAIYAPLSLITYKITVTNYGPSAAQSVIVTDTLPTQHVLYQSTTGNCTRSDKILTCDLGTIGVGENKSFNITERAAGWRGTITNAATVTSSTTDSNASNNYSFIVVTIR